MTENFDDKYSSYIGNNGASQKYGVLKQKDHPLLFRWPLQAIHGSNAGGYWTL